MSAQHNGGPAFPSIAEYIPGEGGFRALDGMTVRDYFAIRAFEARLAKYTDWTLDELTSQSYRDADAMLEARK